MSTKQEKCVELWRERPNSTAAEIAALYKEAHGEDCSVVTARKARPASGNGGEAGPITAKELRAVKDVAERNGGLSSLIVEVEKVANVADQVGGLPRLREVLGELAALLG